MQTKTLVLGFLGLSLIIASCKDETKTETETLTLSLQPDGSSGQDAVFSLIVPDHNYDTLEDIHLFAATQGGHLNANRVAINFDLSSIPDGAKIDNALLSLYFNRSSAYGTEHYGDNDFFIQRITSNWVASQVNWSNQPSSTNQNRVSIAKSTSPTQDFTDMNVTNLVQDMINDRNNSFGFLLKLQIEEPKKWLLFASSNHHDPTIRPKLVITYTFEQPIR